MAQNFTVLLYKTYHWVIMYVYVLWRKVFVIGKCISNKEINVVELLLFLSSNMKQFKAIALEHWPDTREFIAVCWIVK